MTKKQIGRTIAFALVVCLLLIVMCDVFELTDNSYIPSRFQTYYGLEEDSLDAVWVGTSGVDRYWIAAKAYEEYGMTVYPLSSDKLGSWLFVNMLDEALQTQTPELIIVDMRAFTQTNTNIDLADTRARRVLDAMKPFSSNRLNVALKTMEIRKQIDSDCDSFDLSYLFSFIKYHSIWAESDFSLADSISHKECPYMGFYMRKVYSIRTIEQQRPKYREDYFKELDPIAEESLYELLEYVEQKKMNVLFVNTPGRLTQIENGRINTVSTILDERGIDYINFSLTNEDRSFTYIPDLDYLDDFYERNHVNYYGAEKFTEVFSAYLNKNYDFSDHRTEEAVKRDWDGAYERIKEQISSWEEKQTKPNAEVGS